MFLFFVRRCATLFNWFTADRDCVLHPHFFLVNMEYENIEDCVKNLQDLDEEFKSLDVSYAVINNIYSFTFSLFDSFFADHK